MKKLMIAAAAAAMIGSAQAIVCNTQKDECDECADPVISAGIAHKVTISLKTTVNKANVKTAKCEDPECTYWREQKTKKINGLLWEKFDDLESCSVGCLGLQGGVGVNSAFWTNDEALDLEFAIGIGLIGKDVNSKKIEAYGTLGTLAWAGFGSMAATTKKNNCAEDDCTMYVKSISGGIAGQLVPADADECEVIAYEGCCEDLQLANTAAYGTIKISYDKSTAKKVAKAENADDIASFYKLPKAVDADEIVVNEVVIEE